MRKQVTLVLDVEVDDGDIMCSDKEIKKDLEREISCCSLSYDVKDITIGTLDKG